MRHSENTGKSIKPSPPARRYVGGPPKHVVDILFVGPAMLGLILAIAACDRGSPGSGMTTPSAIPQGPQPPFRLSGHVFEVTPGSRVLAANVPVLAIVVSESGCAPPCVRTQ